MSRRHFARQFRASVDEAVEPDLDHARVAVELTRPPANEAFVVLAGVDRPAQGAAFKKARRPRRLGWLAVAAENKKLVAHNGVSLNRPVSGTKLLGSRSLPLQNARSSLTDLQNT